MAGQVATEAFAAAKRRAKYAHRDCLVWEAPTGWEARDLSRDALKAAMLASGTAGHFALVRATATSRIGWKQAVRMLRSFKAVAQ